jgi:microcystin-dependent protein
MSDPYIGEIRMFGGSFAPAGWAFCDGQLIPISENDTLFNLIGTTYGGDGQNTFALPDLRGRVPLHAGTGGGSTYQLAEQSGVETVTLTTSQIPVHNHNFLGTSSSASAPSPSGDVLAQSLTVSFYNSATPNAAMSPSAIGVAGGSQPHDNMQPYLAVSFIISLFGIFPHT